MASSTSNLDQLIQSQASKEITINGLFDAASPATLYGRRQSSSSGLTWGYYGGTILVGSTATQLANGTLTLPTTTTSYIQANPSDGSVSSNTTGFTSGWRQLYIVVTGSSTVTSYIDNRTLGQTLTTGGGDMLAPLVVPEIPISTTATLSFSSMHVCTGTTSNYTVTLPPSSGNAGKLVGLRMSSGLTKMVSVNGNAAELIDGSNARLMWAGESAMLLCDGTGWAKVSGKSIPMKYIAERTSVQTMPAGVIGPVALDSVLSSSLPAMNNASGYCNILRGGFYSINAMVSYEYLTSAYAGYEVYTGIGVNSTTNFVASPSAVAVVPSSVASTATYCHPNMANQRLLSAGDYVSLLGLQNTPVTMNTRTIDVVRPRLSLIESLTW